MLVAGVGVSRAAHAHWPGRWWARLHESRCRLRSHHRPNSYRRPRCWSRSPHPRRSSSPPVYSGRSTSVRSELRRYQPRLCHSRRSRQRTASAVPSSKPAGKRGQLPFGCLGAERAGTVPSTNLAENGHGLPAGGKGVTSAVTAVNETRRPAGGARARQGLIRLAPQSWSSDLARLGLLTARQLLRFALRCGSPSCGARLGSRRLWSPLSRA